MTGGTKRSPLKEKLLLEGIKELDEQGIQNFSVRRIASACGVSCAAPYKHFKDRADYISAIVKHITTMWYERQAVIQKEYPNDTRKQLVEISLDYVRFLVENPQFRSVIMVANTDAERGANAQLPHWKLSGLSQKLIKRYCQEANLSPENALRKTYIVRSLICGAAVLFESGELDYTEENMEIVAFAIDREFDLP